MLGIRRLTGYAVVVIVSLALVPMVSGQDAQQDRGRGSRRGGPRGSRQDSQRGVQQGDQQGGQNDQQGGQRDGRGSRGDRRGRGGPPGPPNFTPEDRERFYNEAVDRYMERMTERYELNDQQKTQVRSRLDEIKVQQKAYSEQHQKDFEAIRTEMQQQRENGVDFRSEEHRALHDRMRTLFEQAPLMNRDSVTAQVEELLPAEQVQKGRARHEAEHQEWDRRREEMRRQWEQRRQQQGDQPSGDQNDRPPWFSRGRRDGERRDGERSDRQRGEGDQQGQDQQGQPDGQEFQPPLVENPIGPWDRYVRDFTRRYRLDDSQQATAQSVLREMLDRREAYEQSHRDDFDAARKLALPDQQKRLAELNQPVEYLFSQLKSRLDRIPTTEQRRAAGDFSLSTSRPATPSSAPAGSTSRPAN